jgi:hypothetical protein
MKAGSINLKEELTPEQEKFYRAHHEFVAIRIHDLKHNMALVTFQSAYIRKTDKSLRAQFEVLFRIHLEKDRFESVRQKTVNVRILDNYDILISADLEALIPKTARPFKQELETSFQKGIQEFEARKLPPNLTAIYRNTIKARYSDQLLQFAHHYRLKFDAFLDPSFFARMLHKCLTFFLTFPDRPARTRQIKRTTRTTRTRRTQQPYIAALINLAYYFTYKNIYKSTPKRLTQRFPYALLEDKMEGPVFYRLYSRYRKLLYLCKSQRNLRQISANLEVHPIITRIAFRIMQKVRLRLDISVLYNCALYLAITMQILEYPQTLQLNVFTPDFSYNKQLDNLLKTYGYRPSTTALNSEEVKANLIELVTEKLDIDLFTPSVRQMVLKTVVTEILDKPNLSSALSELRMLRKRIEWEQQHEHNMVKQLPKAQKERLALFLLTKIYRVSHMNEGLWNELIDLLDAILPAIFTFPEDTETLVEFLHKFNKFSRDLQ